jgi:hypothetical protein
MTDIVEQLRRYAGSVCLSTPTELAAADEILRLRSELDNLKNQDPVVFQFMDTNGKWCEFIDQRHYDNTVKDGRWPIRALYAAPKQGDSHD